MKMRINPDLTKEELETLTRVMKEMNTRPESIHKERLDRDSVIYYP
jgi:hypothetical protein